MNSRQILSVLLIVNLFITSIVTAQPATQPTTRGGRGRGPISSSPRDQLPFSNGDIAALNPNLPTLFICGDSTAARGNPDTRGWGALMIDYLDTSKINICNYSQGGINFPGYFAQRWPAVVAALKPGDFVVMELGHNGGHLPGTGDETRENAPRGGRAGQPATAPAVAQGAVPTTAPDTGARRGGPQVVHTFGWYIRTFIREARAKGATPIVSTVSVRNIWTNPNGRFNEAVLLEKNDNYNPADDRVERGMGDMLAGGERTYVVWARQVANEEKAAFVDHSNIAADHYEKVGREVTKNYHPQDRTHYSTEGAIVQAETFVSGLKAVPDLALVNFLNDKGKAIPPYKPSAK